MTIPTYDLVAAHPFVAGMTKDQLDHLSQLGTRSTFHAGARMFSEGGRADRFWLIREGQVALDTHVPGRGDVVIETLGPGAVLGWSWLFPPYRWRYGATAVTQTLTIAFDAAAVRRSCAEDPAIGYQLYRRFIEVVTDRLQATRLRLLDLYGGES
jgi:CRP/FNR family cyclic AMP-dependent transcriptional regulator